MSYQKKYMKYKSKYIALNIKNNNQIQKELYGGEPKTFNNLFKITEFNNDKITEFNNNKITEFNNDKITEFNDDRLYEFKKDKITDFNNDKICEFNDDILINKLSELKEQKLNIDNDQVVIEYFCSIKFHRSNAFSNDIYRFNIVILHNCIYRFHTIFNYVTKYSV